MAQLSPPRKQSYSAKAGSVPGILSTLFLIAAVAYLFSTHVVMGHLRPAARLCILGVCLCGLVIAARSVWSLKDGGTVQLQEVGRVWAFLRGPTPEPQDLRRLYFTLRTYITIMGVMVMFILTWFVCWAVGLA